MDTIDAKKDYINRLANSCKVCKHNDSDMGLGFYYCEVKDKSYLISHHLLCKYYERIKQYFKHMRIGT